MAVLTPKSGIDCNTAENLNHGIQFINLKLDFIHLKILLRQLCWTLDVSRTAFYEITFVGVSVGLSVYPSLSFLKIGSLVFSVIVHDDG